MAVNAVPKPGEKKTKRTPTPKEKAQKPAVAEAPKPEESKYSDTSLGTKSMKAPKNAQLVLPGERKLQFGALAAEVSPIGLVMMQSATFEQWEEVGSSIAGVRQWTAFAIGDWFNFGERKFGERSSNAIGGLQYSEQTLANFASVAHRVPLEIRDKDLTWTHHEAVAKLKHEDQKVWLAKAKENGWSSQVLRDVMKEELGGGRKSSSGTVDATPTQSSSTPITNGVPGATGAAPIPVRSTASDVPSDDDEGEILPGDNRFEMTPAERKANALYQNLARMVIGFKPTDVPPKDIADLLEANVATALYEALPTFGAYLVELHSELGRSLNEPVPDDEDDEEGEEDDEADGPEPEYVAEEDGIEVDDEPDED